VAFLIAAALLAGAWFVARRYTDAAHYHAVAPAAAVAGEAEPVPPPEPSLQG
jgi:ApbE superfamily uncharacterized protein (UPF0280 family)